MTQRVTVRLDQPVREMAQEEIQKQVAFLARGLANVRFGQDGAVLEFDAPPGAPADLAHTVKAVAQRVQRSLRSLERKVVYRNAGMDHPQFRGAGPFAGVQALGPGQVALRGLPLRLFRYFDRAFEALGSAWNAEPLQVPTLIPAAALARCDYFRSFPHNVTFAAHLAEDAGRIDGFRARHQERDNLDDQALADMATPKACLSPAVCYHVYHLHEGQTLPAAGLAFGVCGKCFRYEAANLSDLRRLWDFTLREVVFLGDRSWVLACRQQGTERVAHFLEEHELAAEIRTASDPFFVAPDALAKTYFQLSSETKYEISLPLPGNERIAVGSLNYHTDFFGRAFGVAIEGAGPMHSVCIGFGLERWVHGFLVQHGADPARWPRVVREAIE